MLTNQEVFDKVVARLTDGRGQALDVADTYGLVCSL